MTIKWGAPGMGLAGGTVTWSFAVTWGSIYSFDAAIGGIYQQAVRSAFDAWENVANIDFVEVFDSAASNIRLGWDTIDGRNNVAGEATAQYIPGMPGTITHAEIRFDIAESWLPVSSVGADMFYKVGVHEIGHAIGLDHSPDPASIMYPTTLADTFSAGDIAIVQQLYGAAGSGPWLPRDIEVVATTYQFFTGHVPTEAGFDYLIDSPANPNDLNDSYYQNFNQENRYINFANNLGSFGSGAPAFDAAYSGLTFEAAVVKAYDEIVGTDRARAAGINVDAAIDFIENAYGFYAEVAQERVVSASVPFEDAVKIVMIGSVLNEAMKSDVGLYADAVNHFVAAYLHGQPVPYGTDLFPPVV